MSFANDQTSTGMFVNISTGNVGIGTLNASNITISGSSVGIGGGGGGILANVGWTPTTEPYPTLTLPAGGAFTASRSNGQHLWVGNEVQYTFNVAGTVAAAPTNTALDYTISVPYPVATAASYPADTIVGDLWLTVVYSGNSNLFKAYARTIAANANALVVRAITGTTDESLGTLLAGSAITLQGTATYASTSVNQNTGGALAAGLQTVWIPSTAVNWAPTETPPAFTLPAGAALTYSRSNARYMYVGTDVTYNVDIGGTLTSSPTFAASDYLLSVPYAVALTTYTNPTIVGELWLSVVNGVNSNTFKAYARTLTADNASNVALRLLTGTADEAFGALTSGSAFTLQGTVKYTTTSANSSIGVPTSYVAANFRQDVYGNVGLNTGASNIRAKFDVIQSSNIPALVVDQYGTGDVLQVMDGGVTKLSVNSSGITTISGGVISNSGDGTINRNLLSEIPASNMYLQLYKTGNRTSNTGPSIVFGGSYYPTEDFPTVYAAIKGVATPYVASSADSLGGMLKFYVNNNVAGGASLEEVDCRMVIDQYGNVGIGTANPLANLHVNGSIKTSELSAINTTITIPTNNFIQGTDVGSISAPSSIVQIKPIYLIAPAWIQTSGTTPVYITQTATINPKFTNSIIKVELFSAMANGSSGNSLLLVLERRIGTGAYVTLTPINNSIFTGYYGWAYITSGWGQINISYIDVPNTASTVEYRAYIRQDTGTSQNIFVHPGQIYGWTLTEIRV